MKITNGLVEQHIHGAFGVDFMSSSVDEILNCSERLLDYGVCAFFPTIMTDSIEKIKERIEIIKEAKNKQGKKSAQIAGIHLEGPFINPEKSGIHQKEFILPLEVELFKQIEDDLIKIVTIAPELDLSGEFRNYLKSKGIKISLGHSLGVDFTNIMQVTHLYNAMGSFSHRGKSTVTASLVNDNIYIELIADSMHVSDDVLRITFKQKSLEKILLISDALPLAHSKSDCMVFAGQKIYNKDSKLVNKDNIIAGSSMLLCDIIKNLADKNILTFESAINCASTNQLKYHNLKNTLKVYWNDDYTVNKTQMI